MSPQHDPCDPQCALKTLLGSVEEANARPELFADKVREDNVGPYLIVVDDFYAHPQSVRELALAMRYVQYSPPVAEIAGEEIVRERALQHPKWLWLATAVVTYLGKRVATPFHGQRYNPEWLLRRLSDTIEENIDSTTWQTGGDYWNGAFHLIDKGWENGTGVIHHHYKPFDIEGRGWSGLIYLSENPPERSGTSVWRNRESKSCIAPYGKNFDWNVSNFDLAYLVENRFNRLVLFRENVLHRAERGFGTGRDARLTQTFFFRSAR